MDGKQNKFKYTPDAQNCIYKIYIKIYLVSKYKRIIVAAMAMKSLP